MKTFFGVMFFLLACASIVLVIVTVTQEMRSKDDFERTCTDLGGRPLIYSYGADLCVAEDGRIVIVR